MMIYGTLVTLLLAAGTLSAQDKKEFRYRFEKGQKFNLSLQNATKLKFERIPEGLQAMFGDDPINITFKGVIAVEVTGVKKGLAQLRGTWSSMKVKGTWLMNPLDFTHGAGEEEKKEKKKSKPEDDPGLDPFGQFANPEEQFQTLAGKPLFLQVDPLGRISLAKGRVDGFFGLVLSFVGLVGPMPEKAKGSGDTWENKQELSLPGLPGAPTAGITSSNTYTGDKTVEGRDYAVVSTKFVIASSEEKKDKKEDANPFAFQFKVDGKGDGLMHFSLADGRPAKTTTNVRIKVSADLGELLGGGDEEMVVEAVLNVKQDHQFSR